MTFFKDRKTTLLRGKNYKLPKVMMIITICDSAVDNCGGDVVGMVMLARWQWYW